MILLIIVLVLFLQLVAPQNIIAMNNNGEHMKQAN